MLRLVGAGTGFGLVAGLAESVGLAQPSGWLRARRSGDLAMPKGAIIRTVVKDVSPDALGNGATLFHEHLIGVGSYSSPPSNCPMPCAPPVSGPSSRVWTCWSTS